ncbi:hypothetical protein EPO15_05890 [bacterium]|nr:MAG: hypothetical protein EPO15_05890 [bacterium]
MALSLLKVVGPADVMDIALVAVLVYALLVWFKRARAAFVAKGILVVAAVYLFARTTGMVMTTGLFHAFFAILLVALLVIFQEELRSLFERIAVWSFTGGASPQPTARQAELIVKACGDLARDRIGALVVLHGLDPLERHLEGGWSLGGELSEPLLKSIFDFHSEGHDGAVIIEGERASRFGVRLPLSKSTAKLAGLGTRHAAALGLAELTDALCIVVSEERGTISAAEGGRLEPLDGVEALRARVARFRAENEPTPARDAAAEFFRKNGREKLIAGTAALVLWMVLVLGAKEWRQTFEVPVRLRNVPAGLGNPRLSPPVARLTLSGALGDFFWLDLAGLAVRVDASQLKEGVSTLPLAQHQAAHPPRLVLEELSPDFVSVTLSRAP